MAFLDKGLGELLFALSGEAIDLCGQPSFGDSIGESVALNEAGSFGVVFGGVDAKDTGVLRKIDERVAAANIEIQVGQGREQLVFAVKLGGGQPESEFTNPVGLFEDIDAVEVVQEDMSCEYAGVFLLSHMRNQGAPCGMQEMEGSLQKGAASGGWVENFNVLQGIVELMGVMVCDVGGVWVVEEAVNGLGADVSILRQPVFEGSGDDIFDKVHRRVEGARPGAFFAIHEGFEDVTQHHGVEPVGGRGTFFG